jgi:type I restriction enzyme, S subunit
MSEWKEVLLTEITTKIGDGLHGTPFYENRGEYYFINGNNLINGKISSVRLSNFDFVVVH